MSDFKQWAWLWPMSFDFSMVTGVQARVHDPIWLLTRQWQLSEFRHDGGSTPVDVCVDVATARPTRMRPSAGTTRPTLEIRLGTSPFESIVEQEPIYQDGLEGLRLRAESGLCLQRLLREAGLGAAAQAWATRCPFSVPTRGVIDDETRDWFDTVIGRVPDARLLGGRVTQVIAGTDTSVTLAPGELDVLKAWRAGTGIALHAPNTAGNWDPEQLQYRLSIAAVVGPKEVVLNMPEYVEGTLDWYAFDVGGGSLGLSGQGGTRRFHRLPVPLSFAGMPGNRFWSFEDPSCNFDTLELFTHPERPPSATAMMALEFALSYGDDWFQVPLPLEPHVACEVTKVLITDCFGDQVTAQRPAGRWNLYRLDDPSAPDQLSTVFLNAAPGQVLEGEALEEIHLLRDEQANLAWAIEATVPHPLGGGRPSVAPPAGTRAPGEAGPMWTLAPASLPRHWFPLVPAPSAIGRLALGTLWTARDARPLGRVLTELLPGKQLHEEQVPSEGVQVTRRWQAARAVDGSLHLWVGRAKTPRQTDAPPGLRFDVVER